jgi:hypothetical protein
MAILNNFPALSQLTSITTDGAPSEDAQLICVGASIGMGIQWYRGKNEWDTDINPDRLKDAADGQGYVGTTAAISYVPFCEKLGFVLYSITDTPENLVQHIHQQIQAQHVVIVTVPDNYVSASLGWSHVLAMYGELGAGLLAMDPYPLPGTNVGHTIHNSDAQWASLLRFNQIWVLIKVTQKEVTEVPVTIDIHTAEIAKHYKELNPHQWECTDEGPCKGKVIQYAMLDNYKKEGNAGLCGYDLLGRPMSNEITVGPDDVIQFYEFGVRRWKLGVVRPCPLYDNGPGTDPAIAQQAAKALAAYKALQAQYAALQKQTSTGVPPALLSDIQQVEAGMQQIVTKATSGKY